MPDELKPCPCCESTNVIGKSDGKPVYCKQCHLRGADAERWNHRAKPDAGDGLVEQMRKRIADHEHHLIREDLVSYRDHTAIALNFVEFAAFFEQYEQLRAALTATRPDTALAGEVERVALAIATRRGSTVVQHMHRADARVAIAALKESKP